MVRKSDYICCQEIGYRYVAETSLEPITVGLMTTKIRHVDRVNKVAPKIVWAYSLPVLHTVPDTPYGFPHYPYNPIQ